jgi:DNA-binding protein YbaB
MADEADYVYDLRDEFDREAQRLTPPEGAPSLTAEDESGVIRVEWERDSGALWVTVTEGWRAAYGEDGLGAAIIATVSAIGAGETAAWAEQLPDEDGIRTRPLTPVHDTPTGRFAEKLRERSGEIDLDVVTSRLFEVLGEIADGVDGALDLVRARVDEEIAGSTFAGNVTAVVNGVGNPVRIEFSTRWLRTASASVISNEVTQALDAARERVDPERLAHPLTGTGLARFANLPTDPDGLIRMIIDGED